MGIYQREIYDLLIKYHIAKYNFEFTYSDFETMKWEDVVGLSFDAYAYYNMYNWYSCKEDVPLDLPENTSVTIWNNPRGARYELRNGEFAFIHSIDLEPYKMR